jgi:Ca2+/Na+ antiporter
LPEGFFEEERVTRPSAHRTLLRGLVWFFVGVALLFALPKLDEDLSLIGLVPMAVGAAYLLYYMFAGRKEAELTDAVEKARLAETNLPPRV